MTTTGLTLTSDQARAYSAVLDWIHDPFGEVFFTLGGAAGTGKTTLLRALRDPLQDGRDVLWTATTGKAARRLSEVAATDVKTMHSRLYAPPDDSDDELRFDQMNAPPEAGSLVVLDEASMTSPQLYEDMETWAQHGVRFLLVGDPFQLPPIISKAEEKKYGQDFTVFAMAEGVVLTTVVRSTDDIAMIGQEIRDGGALPRRDHGAYTYRRGLYLNAIRDWFEDPDDHVLVTWRNAVRMRLNSEIREALGRENDLPETGEPVLFCQNGQRVLNGEVATTISIVPGPQLAELQTYELEAQNHRRAVTRVTCVGRDECMDGGRPKIKDWSRYTSEMYKQHYRECGRKGGKIPVKRPIPITWGYALTAHKAQGSEWRRVTVFLSENDTRNRFFFKDTLLPDGTHMKFAFRWIYTAVTRARARVTMMIGPEPE